MKILKYISQWLDVIFLIIGMTFLSIGTFEIYIPAGYFMIGICFIAIAFFVAKKQANGGGS